MAPDTHLAVLIALWALGGVVVVLGLQYVLTARVFLTSAARAVRFGQVRLQDLPAQERLILESADSELQRAGFRPLFVGQCAPMLTYFSRPEAYRVFLAESEPIRATVARRLLPELGAVVSLELETSLTEDRVLVTRGWEAYAPTELPGRLEESMPGAGLGQLLQRHRERLAAMGAGVGGRAGVAQAVDAANADVEAILRESNRQAQVLRADFRAKGYTVATAAPDLDRFTLRGAMTLAHLSIKEARAAKARRRAGAGSPLAGSTASPSNAGAPVAADAAMVPSHAATPITQHDIQLRIAADMIAAQRAAARPIQAPGPNPALLTIMLATIVVFFFAAVLVFDATYATILLGVLIIHEGGHALAMRLVGYRDVNVFFVPFFGALTVGNDNGASIRQRVLVSLAGPVPGLWLSVVSLVLLYQFGAWHFLKPIAVVLFLINAINLLPLTPLDGGRTLEVLTPPESLLRVGIQAISGVCLLVFGLRFRDPVLIMLGAFWLYLLRRQHLHLRLRREIAHELHGRSDPLDVVEVCCTVLASPVYASWRSITRINTTKALVRQFAEIRPTGTDRLQAALLYAFAWVPATIALLMWRW